MSDTAVAPASESLFETLEADEWAAQGGGGAAERGLYTTVIGQFAESGKRYATISLDRGRFAGKKPTSVATALKNAVNSKNAPKGTDKIKITSRSANKEKGVTAAVFMENTAVAL